MFDFDNPLEYYQSIFPNDSHAEEKIKKMMIDGGNKYYKLNMQTIEDFEKHGVSELDLDILVLAELEDGLS
jgi:hypothetical protein